MAGAADVADDGGRGAPAALDADEVPLEDGTQRGDRGLVLG